MLFIRYVLQGMQAIVDGISHATIKFLLCSFSLFFSGDILVSDFIVIKSIELFISI